MRQILADAQNNPRALMDHMKNPMISQKIQKVGAAWCSCANPPADQLGYHPHAVSVDVWTSSSVVFALCMAFSVLSRNRFYIEEGYT